MLFFGIAQINSSVQNSKKCTRRNGEKYIWYTIYYTTLKIHCIEYLIIDNEYTKAIIKLGSLTRES